MKACPLCQNLAIYRSAGGARSAYRIECRSCGSFDAGWVFISTGGSFSQESRYLLAAIARNASEEGHSIELSSESARELIASTPWPSATEQATRFLAYIARKAKRRGESVPVDHRTDWPLFFAKGSHEVDFIAREMIGAGFIRRTETGQIPHYTITMKGYEELERRQEERAMADHSITLTERVAVTEEAKDYDLFLSHASEDKALIADPLYQRLTEAGCRVWYDNAVLTLGDSLRRKIDEGLRVSRYGVVVLSPAFFAKEWPQKELDGLAARETEEGRKVILPVWHNVTKADVLRYSPPLADKRAVSTTAGVERVATEILKALNLHLEVVARPALLDAWHTFETVAMETVRAAGILRAEDPAPQMPDLLDALNRNGLLTAEETQNLILLRDRRNSVVPNEGMKLPAEELATHVAAVREAARAIQQRRGQPQTPKHAHRTALYPTQGADPIADWWDPTARRCRLCGSKEIAREAIDQRTGRVTFEPTPNPECWERTVAP